MKDIGTRFILLAAACVLAASCASKPKPGFVFRDWSQRMSEMGIYPVFPPREDVAVGDVYLLPTHPYDAPVIGEVGGAGNAGFLKENLFADANWEKKVREIRGIKSTNRIDLFEFLTNYYASRPVLAPTSTNLDATATDKEGVAITPLAGPRPDLSKRTNVFDIVQNTRLKQVAFPDFVVTTVDQASARAMVPIEAVRASFGFSSSDVGRISFKVPQAESYGLPSDYLLFHFWKDNMASDAAGKLFLVVRTNLYETFLAEGGPRFARAQFNDSARFIEQGLTGQSRRNFAAAQKRAAKYIYIAAISEVYYARSIDISVEFTKARSTSASARPLSMDEVAELSRYLKAPKAAAPQTPATPATGNTSGTATTPPTDNADSGFLNVSTNTTVFDLVAQMRTNNIEMSGNIPGGQVKVLSVSQRGVGMRRIFEQPVAIGVRGMLLKLELDAQPFTSTTGENLRGFKVVTE